jgi:hypothetical protein
MKTKTMVITISILIIIGFALYLTVENAQTKANRVKIINNDIDKIVARMNRVLNEPDGFNIHTATQRDDDQTRLLQIASSVKAEINDIIIEIKANGYPYDDKLKKVVNGFFAVYDAVVEDKKFSYNMGDMGDNKMKNDADKDSAKYSEDATAAISEVQSLKVDSSNLTN